MDELYLLFSFAFGSVVGSFLNVCIHRLPRGESIIRPGSHCPHCRSPIAFYDNAPILSYLILRGRCRSCGGRISPRYPLVEAMGGAGAVAAAIKFGFSPQALIYFALLCSLIVVSFIDLDHMIIPDEISLGGLAVGLALSFLHLLHGPKEALG
ncbi:MAG: prepilin peptidase, partial [Deltaproteobacteria bacterium]